MHKREFEKTSGVHTNSRKPTKKCAMKMKVELLLEEKNDTHVKMLLMEGGREGVYRAPVEMIDCKEPQVDDC